MDDGKNRSAPSSILHPPSSPNLSVVVTADDFGIGLQTSKGIIQAHLHGPVTATSLMSVTGDHVRASAPLLADAPNLDVGLHIVLTDCGERPLVARRSSGLIARDGNFLSNSRLWLKAYGGNLDQRAIADEIAAQAEIFVKLLGRRPAYVDGHHHAHQLPIIRRALLDVMEHDLLPRITRVTVEPAGMIRAVPSVRIKRRLADRLGKGAAKAFSQAKTWTNDYYFGMLAPDDFHRPFPWDHYLNNLPSSGPIEWVVHPGLPDDTLNGRDGYRAERAKELDALTSPTGVKIWEHLRPMLARKSVLNQHSK
jgi:hypothetical protein